MKQGKKIKQRSYLGTKLSKKEYEWVRWFEKGENSWWDSFYQYPQRRKSNSNLLKEKSWFNRTLSNLKIKGLFENVPFAFIANGSIQWQHPGFANDGYRAELLEKDMPDYRLERMKII